MQFRVIEAKTRRDVTDEKEWCISPDGTLLFVTNDIDSPLQEAGPNYIYEQVYTDYIVIYPEDFDNDVWEEYCDICGEDTDADSLVIHFNSKDVEVGCEEAIEYED